MDCFRFFWCDALHEGVVEEYVKFWNLLIMIDFFVLWLMFPRKELTLCWVNTFIYVRLTKFCSYILRYFLWAQASQVIQFYGSSLSVFGLFFLGSHFIWDFGLMFLFNGRGYWKGFIESIVWAHNKFRV